MTRRKGTPSGDDSTPDTEQLDKLKELHNEKKAEENPESTSSESETASIQGETGAVTGKRGRHKKDCTCDRCVARRLRGPMQTEAMAPVIPIALAKTIIAMPYQLMANRRGEHWKLSDKEVELMVPAHMELANKYMPDFFKENAALVAVLTMHGMYLWARIEIEKRLQSEQNEQGQDVSRETRFGQVNPITE